MNSKATTKGKSAPKRKLSFSETWEKNLNETTLPLNPVQSLERRIAQVIRKVN